MGQQTTDSTSSSLIRLVQQNDPEAWRQLSRLYAPLVYGWCRQAGLQEADRADIVQDVFAAVHQNVSRFRRDSAQDSFRGWLWTIARNEVRMYFRRRAGQALPAGGSQAHQALQELPEYFAAETHSYGASDAQLLLRRALELVRAEFSAPTWQAFWQTTVDRLSAPAVAEELGISPLYPPHLRCTFWNA